jgi:hypothetical protein
MKGSFILIFDLTLDGCASDGHTSLPDNGNTHFEVKFDKALAEAVTILLYLKFDASIQLDCETLQPRTPEKLVLRNVPTFMWVFPSDPLSAHRPLALVRYVVIYTDINPEPGSHWVAVHFDTRSSSDYFDSSRLLPL